MPGKTLIADVVGDNYVTWHLDHPHNGCTYDLTYHKDTKKWDVELGLFDEDKDDWVFTPLDIGIDNPKLILQECGVGKLVA